MQGLRPWAPVAVGGGASGRRAEARWHATERVAARRRAVEAGGGEDEGGVQWRPGAAKTRAADVNGGGARRDDGAR